MKIYLVGALSLVLLVACNEADRAEIYNENNTTVINGVVYNINEKPINGLYRTYYANGNPRMEVFSQNGLPNGVGKFYAEDGYLSYQGTFKNGVFDGMFYQYYPEGNVHNEMNYKDGIIDGSQKVYDKEGSLTAEIVYKDDKPISGYVILRNQKVELSQDELDAFKPTKPKDAEDVTPAE